MGISILDYETNFIKNRKIDINYFRDNFVTLPCTCNEHSCSGWAIVLLDKFNVSKHLDNNWVPQN